MNNEPRKAITICISGTPEPNLLRDLYLKHGDDVQVWKAVIQGDAESWQTAGWEKEPPPRD